MAPNWGNVVSGPSGYAWSARISTQEICACAHEVRRESPVTPVRTQGPSPTNGQRLSGSHYKALASAVFINERTVHRETRAILDRLGANDAAHAVSEGYKMRLIQNMVQGKRTPSITALIPAGGGF